MKLPFFAPWGSMLLALPLSLSAALFTVAHAQEAAQASKVWVSDLGNGRYKNPVLHADYSDPDAIRVGDDFYMTASSFDGVPGLPVLHSRDLVNWELISHALLRQSPFERFSSTQHGNGVWAPAIRFHKGEFYIYYPDPDAGIYMIKAKDPAGSWSAPLLVIQGKGLIDPCPLWDKDGKVYLAYAYAGSRAGIKSVIALRELNAAADTPINEGQIVYDGHEKDPTIEGPKLYQRNGWYYIFAPAGGVSDGWQLALRSRNIYGPYERKVVMHQGNTAVNGPHQGAWVNTPRGEDWFLHFQDKGVYGRVVHLQPMNWVNDWPVIGTDQDGDGTGEPVMTWKKPDMGRQYPVQTPPESDEFNNAALGKQWQWQANPADHWSFMNREKGTLRLYAVQAPDSARNLWDVPNILLQKFPAETFMATTKLKFSANPLAGGERTGLLVMGRSYAGLALRSVKDSYVLEYFSSLRADKGNPESQQQLIPVTAAQVWLRVTVTEKGRCQFSYSMDGQLFRPAGPVFQAEAGQWIGAKMGLFASRTGRINDSGYADYDWFRVEVPEHLVKP